MGRGPETRPHVVSRGLEFLHVFAKFFGTVAPCEVRVGLVVADLGERVHHRRLREGLGEEEHLGVGFAELGEQLLPKAHGLRVRVVDAKKRDTVRDPVFEDVANGFIQAAIVGIEAQGVDVLILLRWVLGVRDRAVSANDEPFGVLLDPRVIGGALECDVEGYFEAEAFRVRDETVEVLDRAEVGVNGVVATVG